MQYFVFLLSVFSIFFINGFAVVIASVGLRLSYHEIVPSPVIGACLLSIAVTALFPWGVPPHVTVICATVISTAIISTLILKNRSEIDIATLANKTTFARCLWVVAIAALIVLPHYLGGQQFAIFQGNRHDTVNYLSGAFGYANYSYEFLTSGDVARNSSAGLREAANMLAARPTVALLYASFYRLFSRDFLINAYDYCLAGQLNFYFAFLYMTLWITPTNERLAQTAAAAFSIGFFAQYVFDINAWSQLFAVPIMIILFVDYCRALLLLHEELVRCRSRSIENEQPYPSAYRPRPLTFFFIRLPIVAAGLCYMYPEIASVAGLACASALLFLLYRDMRKRRYKIVLQMLFANALFAFLSLILISAYWKGTLGFLLQQLEMASKTSVEWHLFFQAYLFGGGKEVASRLDSAAGITYWFYILLVAPANFIAGVFGLYFLQVRNIWTTAPNFIDILWSGVLLTWFCTVIVVVAIEVKSKFGRHVRGSQPLLFQLLAVGAGMTFVVPFGLLLRGQYWAAGKGLSMICVFVFAALTLPILTARKNVATAVVSMVIAGHLLFGVARPIAVAAHADGSHFGYPYPSISTAIKTSADWDIGRYATEIEGCSLIKIDIPEPFLHRVVQNFVIEKKIPWFSPNPQTTYYGEGEELPRKDPPRGLHEDCTITTNAASSASLRTLIVLNTKLILNSKRLLHAGQELSIGNGLDRILGNGWSGLEAWGVWSNATQAELLLPVTEKEFEQGIRMELSFGSNVGKGISQRLEVSLRGRKLGDWLFNESHPQQVVEISIPASEIRRSAATVVDLAIPDAISPVEFGGLDGRRLGVSLIKARVMKP